MAVNGGGDVGLAVCARPQQSRRRYRSAQQALRGDGGAEIRAPLLFFQQNDAAVRSVSAGRSLGGFLVRMDGKHAQIVRVLHLG